METLPPGSGMEMYGNGIGGRETVNVADTLLRKILHRNFDC